MARILQQTLGVVILVASLGVVSAFVPIGPNNEAYQVPEIGYNPNINLFDALPTGPKAIGEEYRRNTPVMYYSFDQNFIDYYGSNGIAAVDAAFAVLNGLTNVSSYSADLSEIPLEASRINPLAQTLSLLDLKSATLFLMMEQLGLAEADRYVWCLRARENVGPGSCPAGMQYLIIKRNIDPVTSAPNQFQYSSYINGTLLTYRIVEFCTAPALYAPMVADAREYTVDPLSPRYSSLTARALNNGTYFTGLTRDDVGGLRYLLRSNNFNFETAGSNTVTFTTNNSVELLYTSNLTALAQASYLNDAATLTALFPGLQIASTTQFYTNVVSTNTVFYFTNYPWSPASAPPSPTSATSVTTNIVLRYKHEFANVVTNSFYTNGTYTITTTNSSRDACQQYPWLPGTFICTFVTQNNYQSNGVFGDYYILPTNACGVALVATQLVQTVAADSSTTIATNLANINEFFSQTVSTVFTQRVFQIKSVTCPPSSPGLQGGVERIRFVRRDYDSLIGNFFHPVTNTYAIPHLTNNTVVNRTIRRTVTEPDILFSAEDLVAGPGSVRLNTWVRNVNFNTANALPNQAGPGTIETPTRVSFNKVGPLYLNFSPLYLEGDQIPVLIWGSFDGSTNLPVVYPNGTSIVNLENQLFIQMSPASGALPSGHLASNYTNVFSGFTVSSGGTSPYTWSFSPGSAGLPPGLGLGAISGKITGIPTALGTYDFSIRMTDATARYVDRPYSITILP